MVLVLDELKALVERGASGLTMESRKNIIETAAEYGIEFKPTRCKNCYIDAAVLICQKIRERETATEVQEVEPCKYRLKAGVDVWFGSIRVNAATLTNEMARNIIRRGFSLSYFEEYEDNSQNEVQSVPAD